MPAKDNVHLLVAKYLRDNHFNGALDKFKDEVGIDDYMIDKVDQNLEDILEDVRLYNLYHKVADMSLGNDNGIVPLNDQLTLADPDRDSSLFAMPYPKSPIEIGVGSGSASQPQRAPQNVLFVTVALLGKSNCPYIVATRSDKSLQVYNLQTRGLVGQSMGLHKSAVLVCHILRFDDLHFLLTGGMDGRLIVTQLTIDHGDDEKVEFSKVEELTDHSKFLVRIAVSVNQRWLATAGYDKVVNIYEICYSEGKIALHKHLGAQLLYSTTPEALVWINDSVLTVSRRDSTRLYYYRVNDINSSIEQIFERNLCPSLANNQRITFCAMDIALGPPGTKVANHVNIYEHEATFAAADNLPGPLVQVGDVDTTILQDTRAMAIATSHVPHMRLITLGDNEATNWFTPAPQGHYSSPRVVWRPSKSVMSGVWINGDDGIIRGIQVKDGKVITQLKHSENPTIVKAMWAGFVKDQEILVTGGFDGRILVWRD